MSFKGFGNMLVLRMNSKRQRRPNVRLGEIGDVSAAFSHKVNENLEEKWKKHEPVGSRDTAFNPSSGFSVQRSPGFMVSDPRVSPRILTDELHNRENRNPNSSKLVSEFVSSKPRFDFGMVTRKGRVMKRRGRSMIGNNGYVSRAWNFKVGPEISNENGEGSRGDEFVDPKSNSCYEVYTVDGFRHSLDTSKEAHENEWFEPISDVQLHGESDEFWMGESCRESDPLYSDDGPSVSPKSGAEYDKKGNNGSVVNSVGRWLEELGFGKYAGIFEMHEVDEEALPLLTFEDLKEMGINTVGPLRKMYTAIQHLREGGGILFD